MRFHNEAMFANVSISRGERVLRAMNVSISADYDFTAAPIGCIGPDAIGDIALVRAEEQFLGRPCRIPHRAFFANSIDFHVVFLNAG